MSWNNNILPQNFYNRNPVTVAQELLGMYLVRKIGSEYLVGKIIETEAYLPKGDKAAHNFTGKTKRNASLYKTAGHVYIHAMRQYNLLDIVTEGQSRPGSVLIRALEPVEGVKIMKKFRNESRIENLTNGPGKVCQAFKVNRDLDGMDITKVTSNLFIIKNTEITTKPVTITERVGIVSEKNLPLRFTL